MKSTFPLIILFTFFSIIACSTGKNDTSKTEEYQGTIQSSGITTYQYGTHILETTDTFYALKSDNIDLDDYVGRQVTISATQIEGYPIEGGPVYLNVENIQN